MKVLNYLSFGFDEEELAVIEKDKVEYKKRINKEMSKAKKNSKPTECKYCGKETPGFCNSHTLPAFCLRNIAKGGKVLSSNVLIGLPFLDEEKGVNNAGTFQIICRECDGKIFQEYENPDNYEFKPTDKMLAQIAMKNSLRFIAKRQHEYAIFSLPIFGREQGEENLMKDFADDFKVIIEGAQSQCTKKEFEEYEDVMFEMEQFLKVVQESGNNFDIRAKMHEVQELDLKEYEDAYLIARERAKSGKKGYEILFYEKLRYVTPIGFQGSIAVIQDFENNIINDIFSKDPNYKIVELHLCVFPLKEETVVMMFVDANDKDRYKGFISQFNQLCLIDKLSVINYILFLYSEDVFLSKSVENIVRNNEKLIGTSQISGIGITTSFNGTAENNKETYDLNKHSGIDNLLSERYKI